MAEPIWAVERGEGPLLATAVHQGHDVRAEVRALLALDEATRLREEDPHTEAWTVMAPNRIVPRYSRFQVDLNRPREQAVYRTPDDAWGLELWREALSEELIARSLEEYDRFYALVEEILRELERRHGRFVLLDLHSYNHRRDGPDGADADPLQNPEINVGTGTLDRERWAPLVDRFMSDLRSYDFLGRHLDVRENVRFQGGHLSRWVHERFPTSGCVLALECKKIYMDEWTGVPAEQVVHAVRDAYVSTVPGLLEELARL